MTRSRGTGSIRDDLDSQRAGRRIRGRRIRAGHGTAGGRLHDGRTRRDQRSHGCRRMLGRLGADPADFAGRSTRRRWIASAATTTRSTSSGSFSRRRSGAVRCARSRRFATFLARAFQAMTTGRPASGGDLPASRPDENAACPDCGPALDAPSARAPSGSRQMRLQRPPRYSAGADRPIILAGGGALWSGAAHAIETLAARLGAPVVTTLNGKGLLDERHPLLARACAVGQGPTRAAARGCHARRRLPLHRSHDRLAANDRARQLDPDRSRTRPRSA